MAREMAGSPGAATLAAPRSGIMILVVLASLAWLAIGLLDTVNFTVDDTFISFRYAENLATGHGLVYNPGERVEGFSNPLWTVMLAGLARAGWSQQKSDLALLAASKVAGAAFATATLLVLGAFTIWLGRRREWGTRSQLIALAIACTVATYSFPLWSMSGLETPMCACFTTAALALHFVALGRLDAGRNARGLLVAGGLAFGVLTWVRPEQPFVWGLAMLVVLVRAPRNVRRALVASIVPTLILYAGVEAFRLSYYHAWVPNSVVAKAGGGLVTTILGAKYTLAGLGGTIGFVALGLCGLPALLRGRRDWQFLAIYCAAVVLFVGVSGGDWMPGFRFFVPVLPMLWVLSIAATLALLASSERLVADVLVAAIILLFAAANFADGRKAARAEYPFTTGIKGITWTSSPERIALAKQVRQIVPPGSVLATFEAGYVPYFCPGIRILDESGLSDHDIARLPGRHMFKMTADHFLHRKPDFFLTMTGVTNTPSADWVALMRDPRFSKDYEIVSQSDPRARIQALADAQGEVATEERVSYVLYRRTRHGA